jgi:hypothetical protein
MSRPKRGRSPLDLGETGVILGTGTTLGFLVLLPYLFGHWRLADDAYMLYLPNWLHQQWSIQLAGEWPQWLLNGGLGQPANVSVGGSWYYPPQIVWGQLVGWSELSFLYYVLLHLMCGFYLAARLGLRSGLTQLGSLFFAMAFTANGYVIGLLSNPALIFPYLFWPGLILGLMDLHSTEAGATERAIRKIALFSFLIEVSGYGLTKMLLILATGTAYWAMARTPGTIVGGLRLKPLLTGVMIAVIASAPEWVTTFEAVPLMDRMGTDIYDEFTYHSPVNFLSFATLILPSYFLKREIYQLGMLWLERSWWVGSLTLAVIFGAMRAGVLSIRRLHVAVLVSLVALFYAMGGHMVFRELIAWALPPFRHVRHSNNARFVCMAFLAFLGGWAFSALERRRPKGPKEPQRNAVAIAWGAFLVLTAVTAATEFKSRVVPAKLYLDSAAGWKVGVLHTAFFLLLAYTAFALKTVFLGRWKWPAIVVFLQFLTLADAGYAFRHVTAKEEPLRAVAPFHIPSPQPNERSLQLEGEDLVNWHRKPTLHVYNPPSHRLLAPAVADPGVKQLLGSLVSCQDAPDACGGVNFRIDRYFGNTIEVSGTGAKPVLLLIHDLYDPRWHGTVNGSPVPVIRSSTYFKGVNVPAGDWKLHLEFIHPMFPMLWWIAALGIALWLLLPWYADRMFRIAGVPAGGPVNDGRSLRRHGGRQGRLRRRGRIRQQVDAIARRTP